MLNYHGHTTILSGGYIAGIMQKVDLPEIRDGTKTIKVRADGNKLCPGSYMPSSLGGRSISVGRQ